MGRTPRVSDRFAVPRRFAVAALLALLPAALPGCGAPKGDPPEVKAALKALQRNRPKDAMSLLAKNDTARAAWLKAISLERMDQLDDARGQIGRALELDPTNPEFRGFQLRLRIYKADLDAVNELLTIREENRTSAALSLFAFYAHMARSLHLKVTRHEEDAITEGGRALDALGSAVALGADLPEFQREILSLALKSQMIQNADLISGKLVEALPDDPEIIDDRMEVLTMMRRFDAAAPVAQHFYNLKSRTPEAAARFAQALERSTPSPEHDRMFELLLADHPKHLVVIVKRAVYQTRARKIEEALGALEKELEARTDKESRRVLIDGLLGLSLESGEADRCAAILKKHGKEIEDPLVVAYFDGRIRYLQKDYVGALKSLARVIEGQKDAVGTRRTLAAEAVRWTRAIHSDQESVKALDMIARGLRGMTDPRAPNDERNDEPARAELPGERLPGDAADSTREGDDVTRADARRTRGSSRAP